MHRESWRLSLLGVPQLRAPGGQVGRCDGKPLALLTYLALEGSATRARLADLLWPGVGETTGRNNLVMLLRRLRRSAGAELWEPGDHLRLHPGVEVELTLTDRFVDIVEEGYDAVVRLGPIGDTNLVALQLTGHAQIACASPDYIRARGIPQDPTQLAAHTCLGFVNWSGRPYDEWRFTRGEEVHAVQVRSRFQVNDGRVLLAAAIAGHGIILQPEAVVREALNSGNLVPILEDFSPPSRPMYLMFAARRPQLPKLRTFIDHVVAVFGRDSAAN